MSGEEREADGEGRKRCEASSEDENGCADSNRIASVMVGWNSPPNLEYAERWVGRVWPNVKNAERALQKGSC